MGCRSLHSCTMFRLVMIATVLVSGGMPLAAFSVDTRALDWHPRPYSAQHHCVQAGFVEGPSWHTAEAASCVLHEVCIHQRSFKLRCLQPDYPGHECQQPLPALFSYSRHALEHVKDPTAYRIDLQPVDAANWNNHTNSYQGGVHAVLSFYYLHNVGHVVGDDIFAIYQALTMFGLQDAQRIILVSTSDDSVTERVQQLLDVLRLEVRHLADMDGVCMSTLVAGLSRLSFTLPLRHGTGGIILDNFSKWLAARAEVTRSKGLPALTITVVQKDFKSADHPMGMSNGQEVASWAAEVYPGARVTVVKLPDLSQHQLIQLITDTDVLVSSPGSDLMTAVHLQPGAAMVVICYCRLVERDGRCRTYMGMEVFQWYRERGSVYISPYCNISNDEVIDVGLNDWSHWGRQPWHQIRVVKERFLVALDDAVAHVQHTRQVLQS